MPSLARRGCAAAHRPRGAWSGACGRARAARRRRREVGRTSTSGDIQWTGRSACTRDAARVRICVRSVRPRGGRRISGCCSSGPLRVATPFPGRHPSGGCNKHAPTGTTHGRAGGPNVERHRPPAGRTTPELENGDRGGWPPFSKHRCLGRGGCPSHSRCAPGGGARAESHGLTAPGCAPESTVRGHGAGCESGAHAECPHCGGGRCAGPAGRSDRLRARPGHPRCPVDCARGPRRLGGPADRWCAVPQPVRRLHQTRGQLPLRVLRAGGAGPPLHGPPCGAGPRGVPADGADHGPVRSPRDGGAGGAARRARRRQPLPARGRHAG